MAATNDIRVFDVVSIPEMQRLLPILRAAIFGLGTERDGADNSCSMDERGHLFYSNQSKLFGQRKALASMTDAEVRALGTAFIEQANQAVVGRLVLGANLQLKEYIQTTYLKRGIVTRASNPLTASFGHYVVTYGCIVRPSQAGDNVPVFDAGLELRISDDKRLVGFYYRWRPVLGSRPAKKYPLYIQENKAGAAPNLPSEEAQLVYRQDAERDLLLPYYLGMSQNNSFFIPASEYSEKATDDATVSPLASTADRWIRSNYNEILLRERQYEAALALVKMDVRKVQGWADYKPQGQYYNPFRWYNYKLFEQPRKESSWWTTVPRALLGPVQGYTFYDTPTGRKLYELVQAGEATKTNLNPPDDLLRQMHGEVGRALYVPNTQLGKMILGNFDFLYDGYKCIVLARIYFDFVAKLSVADQTRFKNRLFESIATYWTNSGYGLVRETNGVKAFVPIFIYCQEVGSPSFAHKVINVYLPGGIPTKNSRTIVCNEAYFDSGFQLRQFAHEFGHIWGNYDEYKSSDFLEQQIGGLLWKENQFNNDKSALMNSVGTELRDRYFDHFLAAVAAFDSGSIFTLARIQ